LEAIKVEDFYAKLLSHVTERKQKKRRGERAERWKLSESRQRLRDAMDSSLLDDLDELLRQISFVFYIRGYKDSTHHERTLSAAKRTPSGRERFNRIVREMLERNIEMKPEEICKELDRKKVRLEIRNVDGEEAEIVGPGGLPWSMQPIPRAVLELIRRVRLDVKHRGYARYRQSVLG
jgi:hypothetical protein